MFQIRGPPGRLSGEEKAYIREKEKGEQDWAMGPAEMGKSCGICFLFPG